MITSSNSRITALVPGDRWTAGCMNSHLLSRRRCGESLSTKLEQAVETAVGRDMLTTGKWL